MSEILIPELQNVNISGTSREIGRYLGKIGRAAVNNVLLKTHYWNAVTDSVHQSAVTRMANTVRTHFPNIWEELEGLAEGLQLPLDKVIAWNCRGDLLSNVPDGCTTVQIPGDTSIIGHNEDGLPGFKGHSFIANLTPNNAPSFMSFCYPGSLPGHTFAANARGLVQTVNNLRLNNVRAEIPRIVVGRCVLACQSLDQALSVLAQHNLSGGFHMTLAQAGDPRMLSVEFGGGICSQQLIQVPSIHANHALHLSCSQLGQTTTKSSLDRQRRGVSMLASCGGDPLTILRDSSGHGLPIHRCQFDDPDDENTLATAVFHVGRSGVKWSIYDQHSDQPVIRSE